MIPTIIVFLMLLAGLASAQPVSVIEKGTGVPFSQLAGHTEGSVRYRYSCVRKVLTTWYWLNQFQRPLTNNRFLLANAWIDSSGFSMVKSDKQPAIGREDSVGGWRTVSFFQSISDSLPVSFLMIRQDSDSLSFIDSVAVSGEKRVFTFKTNWFRVQEWDGELLISDLTWLADRSVVFKKRKRNGLWEDEYFSW